MTDLTKYRSTAGMNPRLAREFEQVFKVKLSDYWQGILGFDVVSFDDDVIKSGNQSMRDATRQSYGVDAVICLERCLGMS